MTSTQNIDQAKNQIREMLKAEKYPQARIFASQLLRKHGADAELLYLRGTACARRASNRQAVKDLRAAIALRPDNVDYYLALSNVLFASGQFEAALIEYIRVRKFAATHPKVRGYGALINPRTGNLRRAIGESEIALKHHPEQTALVNRLASLYFVSAIFYWHVRQHKNGLSFYASTTRQIQQAERYLALLKALPIATNTVKTKKHKLERLIATNTRRRYDGFMGDPVVALIVAVIGFGVGGFVELWFAFSAMASFIAFSRPAYLFNRSTAGHTDAPKGWIEFVLDMAYASHINEHNGVFQGIPRKHYRALMADAVRALLRGVVMPVAVLAGFYINYSVRHAVGFLGASLLLAYALSQ